MTSQTTGDSSRFDGAWAPEGTPREVFATVVEEQLKDLETAGVHLEAETVIDAREMYIRELETELARLRSSASWRMTRPVRAMRRLVAALRAGHAAASPHAA